MLDQQPLRSPPRIPACPHQNPAAQHALAVHDNLEIAFRVASAKRCFAASMAHSNLTLMAGDDPIGDGFGLTPQGEKALDADG